MSESLRILLLEDVPTDAELVQYELTEAQFSFTVNWTKDRRSYLQALDEFEPDLILSDYSLPDFDGLSAMKLAAEKYPEVPFIFVSGALGEEKAIELLKQGATDYVLKDRLSRLGPAVSRALQEAKSLKERKIAEEERKAAQEALAESEALYRNLFENASIGMFQSTLEGRFLRINKAYATMLGYDSPEEVLSTITDTATQIHVDPRNREELLEALERKGWFYAEQPYFRKDGSVMIGQLAIRKVLVHNGKTAYLEGIVEDITERKRFEEDLINSERELRMKARDLQEANTTLKVLLSTMEREQEDLKERFLDNIKAQVLPYLDELKRTPLTDIQKGFIETAESNLDEIASPFVQKLTSNYLHLTKKEIQIAALVKEGKTSKEIAQLLNAKQRVIDFHRENIRKKLGLNKKKQRLDILLRSFS